jgi:hypothetical protein
MFDLFVDDGDPRGENAGLLVDDGVDLRELGGLERFCLDDDRCGVAVENCNALLKALCRDE